MKSDHPIFLKSIGGVVFVILLGGVVFFRAGKSRKEFQHVSGVITGLHTTNQRYPTRDSVKYRYLQMDHYPKTFELFVGKDAGDFKPQFEKIDQLKAGDSISVFFDASFSRREDPMNHLAYFIDRGPEVIFIKGSGEKSLAYFIIGFSIVGMGVLAWLKKKGKIS